MWSLIGGLIFSGIGLVAFVYGKKNSEWQPMVIGVALMGYPYFVRGTFAVYAIGVALVVAWYCWAKL